MKDNIKRILISGLIAILAFLLVVPSVFVSAAGIQISATRDDIYNQLLAAANINVTANTFKKCISHIYSEDDSSMWGGALNASEISSYDIFDSGNTTITASLWLERAITGEATDGAIWCDEGGSSNIFKQLTRVTNTDWSYWVCDGGTHGLLQRTSDGKDSIWTTSKLDPNDRNCNSFNDAGSWLKATDAADQFKILYTRWRNNAITDNPFIPTYDELGNFNNVDGYFSYAADFGAYCSADVVSASQIQPGTDYQPLTTYSYDGKKIVEKTSYYHVNDNKTWKYSSSVDNPVTSCVGLLDRMAVLETTFNGIARNNRSVGYAGNIQAELQDACKGAKTAEGNIGWHELKTQLEEIIADEETPDEVRTEAQTNLEKLNDIIDNEKYVESSGDKNSDDGKVYQCAEIDGLVVDVENYESGATDISTGSPEGGEQEQTCGNSGGAMSLGWIVCPLLDWMGDASDKLYTGVIEPSLQVKAELLDPSSSGANTKFAWGTFRDFANIVFIILFVVVIFSQLTGMGIDNYGIKRILPKLIVVAILVNLSYYICMVAVDISNIVGSGLQQLFNSIPTLEPTLAISEATNQSKVVEVIKTTSSTLVTGVVILGALAGMVGMIWANPAVILSLLVGALGVIIAICFLFILLSARQAAIIVLVVISPLAFVCYALPNTKKLFDRWLQMGKGLLLVYPIAGALVGGGNFVSKLLLSVDFADGGFFKALTAMIVGIIPIFFIPTVLKSSFAAMGNLGAKISGFGDRMRSGADRKIRNSEGFKDTSARWRAGVNRNGDLTKIGKLRARTGQSEFAKKGIGRAMFGGVAKSQARGMAAVDKISGEDEAAGAKLMGAMAKEGIANAEALIDERPGSNNQALFKAETEGAYYGQQFLAAAARGDTAGMNAAIEAMRGSNMKPKDISKLLRYAENTGKYKNGQGGAMDANTRAAWYRDIAKRYGNDFLATDFELQSFAQMGGDGTLGGYGSFAASGKIGMDDIKPQDVGKVSGDSLAGLISSGLVNQAMAGRAIAENSNLSVDKKMLLGAVADGVVLTGRQADAKKAMEELMKDANFANGGTITIGGTTVTKEMRDKWAAATPKDINIAQVGGQAQPNEVLNIRGGNGGGNP